MILRSSMNSALNRAWRAIAFIGLRPTSASVSREISERSRIVCNLALRFEATSKRFSDRIITALTSSDRIASCHDARSEEHTSELQSLMRISYAVFCLKKKIQYIKLTTSTYITYTN